LGVSTRLGEDEAQEELAEFVSGRARRELAELYLGKEGEVVVAQPDIVFRAPTSKTALAAYAGVTARTVERWADGSIRPSNLSLVKIIRLAAQLAPKEAFDILMRDFAKYDMAVTNFHWPRGQRNVEEEEEEGDREKDRKVSSPNQR